MLFCTSKQCLFERERESKRKVWKGPLRLCSGTKMWKHMPPCLYCLRRKSSDRSCATWRTDSLETKVPVFWGYSPRYQDFNPFPYFTNLNMRVAEKLLHCCMICMIQTKMREVNYMKGCSTNTPQTFIAPCSLYFWFCVQSQAFKINPLNRSAEAQLPSWQEQFKKHAGHDQALDQKELAEIWIKARLYLFMHTRPCSSMVLYNCSFVPFGPFAC